MKPSSILPETKAAGLLGRFPREGLISLLVLAAIWETLSQLSPVLGIPPFAVPSFARIGRSLLSVTLIDVAITLLRVLGALALSFAIGMLLAMTMYLSERAERYGRPLVRLLMAVPIISWILFAILWFRWVEFRIAFVLVVVCAPVFLIDALDSMRDVSKDWRDMLRSFRPSRVQFFTKLMLPATLPSILTSWKIVMSLAIRVVTIAELVGAVTGIGHQLVVAEELFSVADVFAWTLVLVAALFALENILTLIEARLLKWRPQ